MSSTQKFHAFTTRTVVKTQSRTANEEKSESLAGGSEQGNYGALPVQDVYNSHHIIYIYAMSVPYKVLFWVYLMQYSHLHVIF